MLNLGAPIVEWNFGSLNATTSATTTSFGSTFADTNLASTINLVKKVLTTDNTGLGAPGTGTPNTWQFNNAAETNLANALAKNDYMSFTISPDEGFKFSVTAITLLASRGGAANVSVALFSSIGGFTAGNQLGLELITSSTATAPTTISFASLGLADITTSTEFRLYFWGTQNPLDTASNAVGVRLGTNGSTTTVGLAVVGSTSPIPEPSSFAALAGLGALGMVASRRRRRA